MTGTIPNLEITINFKKLLSDIIDKVNLVIENINILW